MDTKSGSTVSNEDNLQSRQDTPTERLSKLLEARSENLKDLDLAMADEDIFDYLPTSPESNR